MLKGLCCVARIDAEIKVAESTGICLPIKCALALKGCYDQCESDVTPVDNDIEMAGAPSAESMA